jgi:hypothetical protein
MTKLTFTDDRAHNYHVLTQLIKSASPPDVQIYWRFGYADDDFEGYTDYKWSIACVLSRLLATKPEHRGVAKAVARAFRRAKKT